MAEDVFFEYTGENRFHEGVTLNSFKGEYSLAQAQAGNDGKIYKKWGYPQKHGEMAPIEKSLPWQIKLGAKDNAIEMLRGFIKALQGTEESEQKAEEDEIPF